MPVHATKPQAPAPTDTSKPLAPVPLSVTEPASARSGPVGIPLSNPDGKSAIQRKMEAMAPDPTKLGWVGQGALLELGLLREIGKTAIETLAGPPGDDFAVATGQTVTGDPIDRRFPAASLAVPFVPGVVKKGVKTAVNITEKALNWVPLTKHLAPKNVPWEKILEGTVNGSAKSLPGTKVEVIERMVWEKGIEVQGKTWKVMEFHHEVGASGGKSNRWIRVEESAGTMHGHPITEIEYNRLKKR